MNEPPLFQFTGIDSAARTVVWMSAVSIWGTLFLGYGWSHLFWSAIAGSFFVFLFIGLRNTIIVMTGEVIISRKWFLFSYRTYRGSKIEDVRYSGDYYTEDKAMGVEVKLGGKEIHLGSPESKRYLYSTLRPLSEQSPEAQQTAPADAFKATRL